MNVAICRNCRFKPFLTCHYRKDGSEEYSLFCMHYKTNGLVGTKDAVHVASIDGMAFNALVDNLLKPYFAHTINPLDLDKLKENHVTKTIEIGKGCVYCLEHRIYDWNGK